MNSPQAKADENMQMCLRGGEMLVLFSFEGTMQQLTEMT